MDRILLFLESEMVSPKPFGWFHWIWIIMSIAAVFLLRKVDFKKRRSLNVLLITYGFVALMFELTKQLIWTFDYNVNSDVYIRDYQWYAAPFQFCTTPMYVSIISAFIKNEKIKQSLLAYMSFFTIWGGFMVMLIPDSCFTSDIVVNIHTMWLHCGGFVVSLILLMNSVVIPSKQAWFGALKVFLVFVSLALALNLIIYHAGILNGETFNMFYISPYFSSELPVFSSIQDNVPYPIFLLSYLVVLSIGATIVCGIDSFVRKSFTSINRHAFSKFI